MEKLGAEANPPANPTTGVSISNVDPKPEVSKGTEPITAAPSLEPAKSTGKLTSVASTMAEHRNDALVFQTRMLEMMELLKSNVASLEADRAERDRNSKLQEEQRLADEKQQAGDNLRRSNGAKQREEALALKALKAASVAQSAIKPEAMNTGDGVTGSPRQINALLQDSVEEELQQSSVEFVVADKMMTINSFGEYFAGNNGEESAILTPEQQQELRQHEQREQRQQMGTSPPRASASRVPVRAEQGQSYYTIHQDASLRRSSIEDASLRRQFAAEDEEHEALIKTLRRTHLEHQLSKQQRQDGNRVSMHAELAGRNRSQQAQRNAQLPRKSPQQKADAAQMDWARKSEAARKTREDYFNQSGNEQIPMFGNHAFGGFSTSLLLQEHLDAAEANRIIQLDDDVKGVLLTANKPNFKPRYRFNPQTLGVFMGECIEHDSWRQNRKCNPGKFVSAPCLRNMVTRIGYIKRNRLLMQCLGLMSLSVPTEEMLKNMKKEEFWYYGLVTCVPLSKQECEEYWKGCFQSLETQHNFFPGEELDDFD